VREKRRNELNFFPFATFASEKEEKVQLSPVDSIYICTSLKFTHMAGFMASIVIRNASSAAPRRPSSLCLGARSRRPKSLTSACTSVTYANVGSRLYRSGETWKTSIVRGVTRRQMASSKFSFRAARIASWAPPSSLSMPAT
jgi:hypothetical protein